MDFGLQFLKFLPELRLATGKASGVDEEDEQHETVSKNEIWIDHATPPRPLSPGSDAARLLAVVLPPVPGAGEGDKKTSKGRRPR